MGAREQRPGRRAPRPDMMVPSSKDDQLSHSATFAASSGNSGSKRLAESLPWPEMTLASRA